MSNPPAGWYPDPTGQPQRIRFWNGEKWTNKTEHEDMAEELAAASGTPATDTPAASDDRTPAHTTPQDQASPNQPAWTANHSTTDPTPQQWSGEQQSGTPDANQPAWSAGPQQWGADQFSSYDDASDDTPQQGWSGQQSNTPQQGWSVQQSDTPQQQWPAQQSGTPDPNQPAWSTGPQQWGADQFSSYEQPDPNAEQTQIQPWPNQQPDTTQQEWSGQASNTPQQQWPGQQSDTPQQQWPAQQSGTPDPNQPAWSTGPQQWGADQFTSYEQPDPNNQQTQIEPTQQQWLAQPPQQQWSDAQQTQQQWSGQPSGTPDANQPAWSADQQPWSADQFSSYEQPNPDAEQTQIQPWPEQQANSSADFEQTQQQPWSGQQFNAHDENADPAQQQQPWTPEQQAWGADQFTSYEEDDATSAGSNPWNNQQSWPVQEQPVNEQPQQPLSPPDTQQPWPNQPTQTPAADTQVSAGDMQAAAGEQPQAQSGSSLWAVREAPAADTTSADQADAGGWWQPAATPQLWGTQQSGNNAANEGPRLRAVSPDEYTQPQESTQPADVVQTEVPAQAPASNGPSPAELARATWGAPELAPAPAEHWTQRDAAEAEAAEAALRVDDQAEPTVDQPATRTLKLAADGTGSAQADDVAAQVDGVRAGEAAARAADEEADRQAADDAEGVLLQPDWGSQAGDEQDDLSSDVPAWGVEATDEDDPQTPEKAAPLWTVPVSTDTTPEPPVQLWGDQQPDPQNQQAGTQNWNGQQAGQDQSAGGQQAGQQGGHIWGSQQNAAGADTTPVNNGWGAGDQHGVQESGPWAQQPDAQNGQNANQSWNGGQSWPVQEAGNQQSGNGWGDNQQSGQQAAQQGGPQQWGAQQGTGTQQAPQRAWGDDGNEPWGGQTDLSSGVGKRDKGKTKKSKSPGGGGPFGGKLPMIVGGGIALVLIIATVVVLVTRSGDKTADPNPTGSPTQSTSASPTGGTTPGQSKNPKLHEGDGRIASTAISFPRRNPPWSDRKRLIRQLLNSNGQRIVLTEQAVDQDDWSADIFVGGLGTASGFTGDAKATALSLSTQMRDDMYGNIPVTFKPLANGAVKRSDKSGWFVQQTVTTTAAKVTDRVLTLTVAVFDLGDGTAVAYISEIPNNRPDLKTAADEAYRGIQVG